MQRRIVHGGLVLGRQLGALVKPVAGVQRRSVGEQASVAQAALRPPPVIVPQQARIGALEEAPVAAPREEGPDHEGADRRLRTVEPSVVAGHQAGEVAGLGLPGEGGLQIVFCPRGLEVAPEPGVEQNVVEPDAEPAELPAVPKPAESGVGPPIDEIVDMVPGHHVMHGLQGVLELGGFRLFRVLRPGRLRAVDGNLHPHLRRFFQVEAQGEESALDRPGAQIEVPLVQKLRLQSRQILVDGDQERGLGRMQRETPAAGSAFELSGRAVVAEVGLRPAVNAQQHPEPEAPFAERLRAPVEAQPACPIEAVAPVEARAGEAQVEADLLIADGAGAEHHAVSRRQSRGSVLAGRVQDRREDEPRGQVAHLGRQVGVPAPPGFGCHDGLQAAMISSTQASSICWS